VAIWKTKAYPMLPTAPVTATFIGSFLAVAKFEYYVLTMANWLKAKFGDFLAKA